MTEKTANAMKYIKTDMAVEKITADEENTAVSEDTVNGFAIHRLTVKKPCAGIADAGRYITVSLGKPWMENGERVSQAAETLSEIIKELCPAVTEEEEFCSPSFYTAPTGDKHKAGISSALVLCLGNRKITADAIGPLCSDGLIATRHLERERPEIWRELGGFSLSALTPGVSGETGLEALELVCGAVKAAKPQVVITVDALSARNVERLGTSVQLTDTGIAPGAGIGNRRKAISEKTLGVPVISLGVPTIAHSATLIRDALERSGVRLSNGSLETALAVGGDLFVTPRDCDSAVASMSDIITRAVNLAFLGFQRL